ncbi:MAG: metalloregulator ArsR/SmtB family transcription factor [Alphaproteobacteria bacterium]|nr:metalloregulator ArsR/SmtB family transcription factor [Alphaproteobacteria bacterium]
MVKYQDDPLSSTFAALADPTRRAILARLALGDATVSELAAPFEMSLPAVSKHLGVLEDAGLLSREKAGRVRRCNLEAAPIKQVADWVSHYRRFWEAQLDSLARYLDETAGADRQQQEEENHGRGRDDD